LAQHHVFVGSILMISSQDIFFRYFQAIFAISLLRIAKTDKLQLTSSNCEPDIHQNMTRRAIFASTKEEIIVLCWGLMFFKR